MKKESLVSGYLAYSLKLNSREEAHLKTLKNWLPKRIIDCHAHCNLSSHVKRMPIKASSSMISTFMFFSYENSILHNKLLFPGSRIQTLRFPNVFTGIDAKAANRYLRRVSGTLDRVALLGIQDDETYTVNQMRKYRPAALKMYYAFPTKNATTIAECISDSVLRVAEELSIPIILHLPTVITNSWPELVSLAKRFPNLKVCIPHLGSTKFVIPGLVNAYKQVAANTSFYLDTSLNTSPDVIALALKCFGPERIMYGTDQPLDLIRAKPYIHPKLGQRLITEYQYHWVNKTEQRAYGKLAINLVHSHWQATLALKSAIDMRPKAQHEEVKHKIFYYNAKKFYEFK